MFALIIFFEILNDVAEEIGAHRPNVGRIVRQAIKEFMVLGFTAFLVWCMNQLGVLDAIIEAGQDCEDATDSSKPWNCQDASCHSCLDAVGLLHSIEALHMHLFLAMIAYLSVMYGVLHMHELQVKRIRIFESWCLKMTNAPANPSAPPAQSPSKRPQSARSSVVAVLMGPSPDKPPTLNLANINDPFTEYYVLRRFFILWVLDDGFKNVHSAVAKLHVSRFEQHVSQAQIRGGKPRTRFGGGKVKPAASNEAPADRLAELAGPTQPNGEVGDSVGSKPKASKNSLQKTQSAFMSPEGISEQFGKLGNSIEQMNVNLRRQISQRLEPSFEAMTKALDDVTVPNNFNAKFDFALYLTLKHEDMLEMLIDVRWPTWALVALLYCTHGLVARYGGLGDKIQYVIGVRCGIFVLIGGISSLRSLRIRSHHLRAAQLEKQKIESSPKTDRRKGNDDSDSDSNDDSLPTGVQSSVAEEKDEQKTADPRRSDGARAAMKAYSNSDDANATPAKVRRPARRVSSLTTMGQAAKESWSMILYRPAKLYAIAIAELAHNEKIWLLIAQAMFFTLTFDVCTWVTDLSHYGQTWGQKVLAIFIFAAFGFVMGWWVWSFCLMMSVPPHVRIRDRAFVVKVVRTSIAKQKMRGLVRYKYRGSSYRGTTSSDDDAEDEQLEQMTTRLREMTQPDPDSTAGGRRLSFMDELTGRLPFPSEDDG